jgi:flagellar hook-length control protein FliK
LTNSPKHSVSFFGQKTDQPNAIGEPMIPLILIDAGAPPATTAPTMDVPADAEGTVVFADLMSNGQDSGASQPPVTEDATADQQYQVDLDDPDAAVVLGSADVSNAEFAVPFELANKREVIEPLTAKGTRDSVLTKADQKDGPKLQLDASQVVDSDTQAVSKEPVKADRGTVAQSIVEGRLPQKSQAETAAISTTQKEASVPVEPNQVMAGTTSGPAVNAPDKAPDPNVPSTVLTSKENESTRQNESRVQHNAAENSQRPNPIPVNPATPTVAVQQQAATGQRTDLTEKSVKAIDAEMTLGAATGERATAMTAPSGPGQAASSPDTARSVATQIAMAISNANGNATEISLNPEELGRVRISLTAVDGAITLNVSAERPETQDLMRRHIDQLSQQFRDLGYGTISFSFGKEKGDQQGHVMPEVEAVETELQETQAVGGAPRAQTSSGLDLRI